MRSSQEPTAAAFRQWMVLPGDVSLVSKIATEQAVYPGQCWLTPGKTHFPNNSAWANRNQLQPRKQEAPHWFFFQMESWLLGAGEPRSPAAGHPEKFQWSVTFWNITWKQPGAQDSTITEGSRSTSSGDFPKRLIKKSLCIYKLEHLGERMPSHGGTCPVMASWSNHYGEFCQLWPGSLFFFPTRLSLTFLFP